MAGALSSAGRLQVVCNYPHRLEEQRCSKPSRACSEEHADLERRLSLPETHADQRLAKQLNQRYAELTAVVTTWQEWLRLGDDIEAARELASDDPAFAQEADDLTKRRDAAG